MSLNSVVRTMLMAISWFATSGADAGQAIEQGTQRHTKRAHHDKVISRVATTSIAPANFYPGVLLRSISVRNAHDFKSRLKQRMLFVDVRSRLAVFYTGLPAGIDVHVPFVEPEPGYHWNDAAHGYNVETNASFDDDIDAALKKRGLSSIDPVMLIGDDSKWTRQCAERLAELGYSQIFVVREPFDAPLPAQSQGARSSWKQAGLPWMEANRAILYRAHTADWP